MASQTRSHGVRHELAYDESSLCSLSGSLLPSADNVHVSWLNTPLESPVRVWRRFSFLSEFAGSCDQLNVMNPGSTIDDMRHVEMDG